MVAIIVIALIPIFHFLSDAYYDEGKKTISSYFFSAFLVGVCCLVVFNLTPWYILYFVLCWYISEIIYNIIRKLGWFYVGKTKWTDKLFRWLADTNQLTRGHYAHISFITKLMAAAGIFALFYTGKL
jgi:hypothetical protein